MNKGGHPQDELSENKSDSGSDAQMDKTHSDDSTASPSRPKQPDSEDGYQDTLADDPVPDEEAFDGASTLPGEPAFSHRPAGDRAKSPPAEGDEQALPRDSASEHSPFDVLRELNLPSDRFTIEGKIGKGHSGVVYAIRDRYLNRSIAVKHAGCAINNAQTARFIQEARVAAGLEHPNIIPVFNLDVSTDGRFYMSMRHIKGQSLGAVIKRSVSEKRRDALIATPNDVVNIAIKLCDAVGCAHAQGVVHQDIKPDNIMLGEHGEVLLIDWGTASEGQRQGRRGTPAYMAPEQARKEGGAKYSDIYCIGATMFHALFLRYPTNADDPDKFWARKQRGEIDPLEPSERRLAPARLIAIVLKALEADPSRRYPSVGELTRDLHALQGGLAVSAYREPLSERMLRWYRGHYRTCNAVGAMIALVLGLTGVYLYDLDRTRRAKTRAELKAFQLEKERAERWHLVLDQNFERDQTLDPRLKPDRPFEFKPDGMPFRFDSAMTELIWTEPIGVEQKIEVTFSCDTFPFLSIAPCRHSNGQRISIDLDAHRVLLAKQPDFSELAWEYLSKTNSVRYDGRNTLVVWRKGNRFIAELNGVTVLDHYWSTAPWSEDYGFFSLHRNMAYSPLTVHSLRAWHRSPPDYVNVLEPGKALLQAGKVTEACKWFKSHSRNRYSETMGKEAEYLITRALPSSEFRERRERLTAIVADQDHPFRAYAIHDLAVLMASTDEWQETLDLACRAAHLAPNRDTLNAVSGRLYPHLRSLPDKERVAVATRISKLPLRRLNLPNFNLTDLATVRNSKAHALGLNDNPFMDLEPLRGAEIHTLELGPAPVADLTPLQGLPLDGLTLTGMPVTDLSPLRGMPLQYLRLTNLSKVDMSTIRGVRTRLLQLVRCPGDDMAAVGSTGATVLRIYHSRLPDIRFVASLPLHTFWLRKNELADIEPLRGLDLRSVRLQDNRIENIEPLCTSARMQVLDISGNPVSDLSPLSGVQLWFLSVSRTNVADLSPLKSMPYLNELDISHSKVTDISLLTGMRLDTLRMDGTSIRDLSVLSTMPVLKELSIVDVALDDEALRVLASLSVEKLCINLDQAPLAVLSRMPKLERVGVFAADYLRRTGAAIATALQAPEITSQHAMRLRDLATRAGHVERLLVPVPMSYAEASAVCRALGGTLACPATSAEAYELAEYLGSVGNRWSLCTWIGLEHRQHKFSFQSGASVEWAVRNLRPSELAALRRGANLKTSQAWILDGSLFGLGDTHTGKPHKQPFVVEWRASTE